MNVTALKRSYSLVSALLCAGVLALQYRSGGYYLGAWSTYAIGLALLLALVFALGIPRASQLRGRALVAIAAFAILTFVTLLGVRDAGNRHAVVEAAGLTALYMLMLTAGVLLSLSRTAVVTGLMVLAGGTALMSLGQAALLTSHRGTLLYDGRLLGVVGYYNAQAAICVGAALVAIVLGVRATRRPWEAGLWNAAAAVSLLLAVLTQSRGGAVACAAGFLVLVAVTPARLRLIPLIASLFLPIVFMWHALTGVYRAEHHGGSITAATHQATTSILIGTVAAGVIGAVLAWLSVRFPLSRRVRHSVGAVVAATAVAIVVLAGFGVVDRYGSPSEIVRTKWHEFKAPPSDSASTRFASFSNNGRIELWRVAWRDGKAHPMLGVGAGNFEASYYRHRRSNAGFVRQPHQLTLELYAERGLGAVALVALVLGCVLWSAFRLLLGDASRESRLIAAGLVTLVIYTFVHAQIEWFWQFPAVMLPVWFAAGALLGSPWRLHENVPIGVVERISWTVLFVATLVLIAPLAIANRMIADAQRAAVRDPKGALAELSRVSPLDPWSLQVPRLQAQIHLATNKDALAPADIRRAIRRNPDHWETWVWAASMYQQLGDTANAAAAARRARALNPVQPTADFGAAAALIDGKLTTGETPQQP